ncbi:MAG: PBP1A family penicillin-binding protein [Pseudomonadota bacterium]
MGAIIAYYAATMPPRAEWAVPQRPPNVAILSDTGALIANRGDTGGRAITLSEVPDHVWQAVVAIEDRRFFSHPGVDPIGLARAMAANVAAGRLVQGGSTLTQQLAKNLFTDASRTLERKIQEMILAVWLEIQYDKTEILEMYLNRVYLGAGAYGVDGAARRYFDKPAEDLTIAEAALIAGLLRAPSYYAPTVDLDRANARAATVLKAMVEAGFVDPINALYARENPAKLQTPAVASSGGYVADWVAEVLPAFAGSVTEDVVVETSVNLELQELAQSALQEMLAEEGAEKDVSQGAVVVLDSSGAVKALVGGAQYGDSQYNRAVDAARQPGSSFKPFVYLAALENGLTPQTTRVDGPTSIGNWTPQNYTRRYYGPVTLERALALSLNTIAAQLTAEVGPAAVAQTARRMGIRSEMAPNASIALGTSEVTLIELTTAYVPFSNGGVGVVPHVVRRIKTADGRLLYERRGSGPGEVARPEYVGAMNTMLSAALKYGTAQRAQLPGWQAAGKTGTSQNWRDAWFVGYTAFFTAGVWLGNDDNSPTKRATGGTLPAALWKTLMEKVHEGMVPAELPGAGLALAQTPSESVPADDPWNARADGPVSAPDPETGIVRGARNWQNDEGGGFFRRLFGG